MTSESNRSKNEFPVFDRQPKASAMLQTVSTAVGDYFRQLSQYLGNEWTQMTPSKYGTLLILIGIAGYLLMKTGGKS